MLRWQMQCLPVNIYFFLFLWVSRTLMSSPDPSHSSCVFQRGSWGDGKQGLLILEELLICSLLALRTLITPLLCLSHWGRDEWACCVTAFSSPQNEDVPTKVELTGQVRHPCSFVELKWLFFYDATINLWMCTLSFTIKNLAHAF